MRPTELPFFCVCTAEINVGGIVAAVVVLLIVLGLVGFGIWFAYSRGYFSSKWQPVSLG